MQGPFLGPLLFCLSLNKLQVVLSNGPVFRLLHADNLEIYIQTSPELFHDGLTRLTKAVLVVADWASRNSLTIKVVGH